MKQSSLEQTEQRQAMIFHPKNLNQRGDTLVEVLIAVAVITSVLAGAFLVSQKSSIAVRDSQERSEMLQVLQGQVELVRAMTLSTTDATSGVYSTSPRFFCVDGTDPANLVRKDSPTIAYPLPLLQADDFSRYDAACQNIQGRYNVAVTYDDTTKIFNFYGRWDRLGGSRDQEQLSYRISPGISATVGAAVLASSIPSTIADIGPLPCSIDPITGACAKSLTPPSYHWNSSVINLTNNPGLTVLGCSWLWSDGKTDSNKWCNFNDISGHVWTPTVGYPAYPTGCPASPNGSVTLTMNLSDGSNPTKVFPLHVPNCY